MKTPPKRWPILLAAFLLPACMMTAVLALCGITPFGSRSFGVLDMSNQYLSFLSSLRDLLTGRASALYLPSLAMGGNMAGVIGYYLMSPLNLIVCLFPRERLLEAASVLYVLRVGLCGLTMAAYCGGRRGYGWRVLIPALGYAFMAYMTAYSINYQWHDCVILLPLAALGIARLTEGRGKWLYILSLAGALAVNFYTGYILCLFSVLFFLFELFTGQGSRPRQALLTFALGSLAAGALAAVVLLPAFLSLQGGKAGLSLSGLSLSPSFPFRQMFAKLFPGSFNYDELTPIGLPNIFTGTVTAALAVLYAANGSIPRRRRIGGAILLGLIVLSFWVSGMDLVWHGMNVPAWYNFRYSFLFSFLLAAGADGALARFREGTRPWHLLLPIAAVALCALLAFAGQSYPFVTWHAALWSGVVTALVCGGMYGALRPAAGRRFLTAAAAGLLLVHAADLGLGAERSLDALTVECADPDAWAGYIAQKKAAFALADTGSAFARVESPEMFDQNRADQNRCEPMLFCYDGISHFGSTIPTKNLDFLQRLGIPRLKNLFALYGPGVTAGADSLLAIRYLVASGPIQKPYTPVAAAGGYTVYENPAALPVGWTADAAVAGQLDGQDTFSYIQALYQAAAPEVGQAVYTPAEVTDTALEGFVPQPEGGYCLQGSGGSVTFTLTARADGPLYGTADIPDYPSAMLYVNGAFAGLYATGQNDGTFYLGDFAAGEQVTVQISAFTDMQIRSAAFATESADALAAYQSAMAEGGCPLTKLSGHRFEGSFTTGQGDSLLVLTIPYDSAWRITLDGEPVQAEQIQDCLTAIPVTAGEHTLQMRYLSPGLVPGGAISALTGLGCLALYLAERRRRRA